MIERTFQIRRPGGDMGTFVVHPPGGAFPPVILYMDMWGIRATLANIARSIAAAGYSCILPDLYYRGGKVRYAAQDVAGRRLSFTDLKPERRTALRAAMDRLSDAMVIDDTAFLLDVMSREQAVRRGTVGAVGYCMGGRHALCVAGTFPERIKAAACLHGAGLVSAAEIYFGHAERDRYAPPDVVERVEEALSGCRVRVQSRVHPLAEHGYAMPDRSVFDQVATDQDWAAIFAMLGRQLSEGRA
jgi:carboxymethylenebutenolidase